MGEKVGSESNGESKWVPKEISSPTFHIQLQPVSFQMSDLLLFWIPLEKSGRGKGKPFGLATSSSQRKILNNNNNYTSNFI